MAIESPEMSPEELALFNELISNHFGIHFPEHKRQILEARLHPRLVANHVRRFIDYYLLLQFDLESEIGPLTRAITNNESYFFRETQQFEALDTKLLDALEAGGQAGTLRFLSAGCSSGEEPYSLNIFLREPFRAAQRDLQIDAFDLDQGHLAKARHAIYRPNSLRALSPQQKSLYFKALDDGTFELRARFREHVELHHGNLLDANTLKGRVYDVVFCRNVLIYFTDEATRKTIDNFVHKVRPGGLLFLGHSESIIGLHPKFQAERVGQSIAYRRLES